MKIKDLNKASIRKITEQLAPVNDTGFLTEDLAKVIDADQSEWSEAMTGEELTALMESWTK